MPEEHRLARVRSIFGAMADQQRLKILFALRTAGELCVSDVAHVLDVSVSVASHQLRRLRELGILEGRDVGRMAYYRLRRAFVGNLVVSAMAASS
jgi:DNA-binding transcriptional ArsR family regulator